MAAEYSAVTFADGSLEVIQANIRKFEFEGIVAKRLDSLYQPGETPGTWLKQKLQRSEDFVMGGYISGVHGVDEILVGKREGKSLHFVASVKNGSVPASRRQVFEAVRKLKIGKCPFSNLPEKKGPHAMDREKMKNVQWLRPKIICEIAFNEWTVHRNLRHSRFLRLHSRVDL